MSASPTARRVSGFASALIVAAFASDAYSATLYTETIVQDFTATGISPTGVMIGYTSPAPYSERAATYENGEVMDLGLAGGVDSRATAQNSSGLTVGYVQLPVIPSLGSPEHAVTWQNGVSHDLGCAAVCTNIEATDVNGAGTIVGSTSVDIGQPFPVSRGFVYQNGAFTIFGTLGGQSSSAEAINSSGEIVGTADTATSFVQHAVIFQNGNIIDLDQHDGYDGVATAVNDSGTVAGYIQVGFGSEAAIWDAKGLTILGNNNESFASAINNAGIVVGSTNSLFDPYSFPDAYIWSGGVGQDLNTLTGSKPQATLFNAVGINNKGQIAGNGYAGYCDPAAFFEPCDDVAILLTPVASAAVPEPATWAMIIIGFGLAGSVMRYRSKTTMVARVTSPRLRIAVRRQ